MKKGDTLKGTRSSRRAVAWQALGAEDPWWAAYHRAWESEMALRGRPHATDACYCFFDPVGEAWILNVHAGDVEGARFACDVFRESARLRSVLKRWPSSADGLLRVVLFKNNPSHGPILAWSYLPATFVVGEGEIVWTGAPMYLHPGGGAPLYPYAPNPEPTLRPRPRPKPKGKRAARGPRRVRRPRSGS